MLYHLRGLNDLSPEYDLCPEICGEGLKKAGSRSACDECPKRDAKNDFKERTIGFLDDQCGRSWRRYGFDNLYGQVLNALDLGDDTSGLTLTAAICVRIVESERSRIRRIDEWNAKQKKGLEH